MKRLVHTNILEWVWSWICTEPSSFSSLFNIPYSKDIYYFIPARHITHSPQLSRKCCICTSLKHNIFPCVSVLTSDQNWSFNFSCIVQYYFFRCDHKIKNQKFFNCKNLPQQRFELVISGSGGGRLNHWATEATVRLRLKQFNHSRGFMKEQICTMTWTCCQVRARTRAEHIFKIGPVLRPRVILAYHTHSRKYRRSLTLYNDFLHLRCKKSWNGKK